MPQDYDPAVAIYVPQECGRPMLDAVAELAMKTGQDPADFNGRTMSEIFQLAEELYEELPDFWRIWKEWHAPQPRPKMGDL